MRKGFTLVELLAVIVILAIILAIAIPSISGLIKTATKSSFENDVRMILKAIEYKTLENKSFDPSSINEDNANDKLNISSSNYKTLTVKKVDNIVHVTIVGQNKWDDLTGAGATSVVNVDGTVTDFVGGANMPVLTSGMTPVKWNGTTWENTTENDPDWYSYKSTDKRWANARTDDGSMWVWIPRFIYRIPTSNWHTTIAGSIDIQFTKGIDDNWNKGEIGNIDLREGAEASKGTWTNHPAFTFGNTELTGFWIAKFEASNTMEALNFVPNAATRCCQTAGNIFDASRNIEKNSRYGWGTSGEGLDSHMTKNNERGAVVYLSQSVYGKNAEIWKNNSSTFITGCTGANVSASSYAGCEYAYNTDNGVQASTTGNIYGVYDMSGGAWELVSAYIDNGGANLENGNSIINANIKYKSVYSVSSADTQVSNFDLTINHKGDALYETGTSSNEWFGDYPVMPSKTNPWLGRGGYYQDGTSAGAFAVYSYTGVTASYLGFRVTIAVSDGL